MTNLVKPSQNVIHYYNYNECRNYLEKKYGYDERDYANKYVYDSNGMATKRNHDVPYQDFWHWVVDRFDVTNGGMITFSKYTTPEEDWQKEIYQRYMDEFAENGELIMKTSW